MTASSWRLTELTTLLQRRGMLVAEPFRGQGATVDPQLRAVVHDSRRVQPGDLFVARPGRQSDGHDHAPAAVQAGAVALLVERPLPGMTVPQLIVTDAAAALGVAAAWRAGDPSQRLGIVGITGTDGKTTTAYLTRAVLEAAGHRVGLIGTTDVLVGGRSLGNEARASTPEAPELQGFLAAMVAAGDDWAVVESTSHGLAQQRVAGIAYDVAVLTNITSEHLELHGTVEAYREAKRSLFARLAVSDENPEKGHGKHAVVNADDPEAEAFARTALDAGARVVRYGLAGRLGSDARGARRTARCGSHRGGGSGRSDGHRHAIGRLGRRGQPAAGRTLQRPQRPGGHGRGCRARHRPRRGSPSARLAGVRAGADGTHR